MADKTKPATAGAAIRHHMERTGKTVHDLARATGLTKAGIWYILDPAHDRDPAFGTVRRIAAALGVRLDTLAESMPPVKLAPDKPAKVAKPAANGKPKAIAVKHPGSPVIVRDRPKATAKPKKAVKVKAA